VATAFILIGGNGIELQHPRWSRFCYRVYISSATQAVIFQAVLFLLLPQQAYFAVGFSQLSGSYMACRKSNSIVLKPDTAPEPNTTTH
jgi:hypothetical protein